MNDLIDSILMIVSSALIGLYVGLRIKIRIRKLEQERAYNE